MIMYCSDDGFSIHFLKYDASFINHSMTTNIICIALRVCSPSTVHYTTGCSLQHTLYTSQIWPNQKMDLDILGFEFGKLVVERETMQGTSLSSTKMDCIASHSKLFHEAVWWRVHVNSNLIMSWQISFVWDKIDLRVALDKLRQCVLLWRS